MCSFQILSTKLKKIKKIVQFPLFFFYFFYYSQQKLYNTEDEHRTCMHVKGREFEPSCQNFYQKPRDYSGAWSLLGISGSDVHIIDHPD
jgi:hypothetical protein